VKSFAIDNNLLDVLVIYNNYLRKHFSNIISHFELSFFLFCKSQFLFVAIAVVDVSQFVTLF